MKTIDAIKRLERAGAENSRVNQKLRESVRELAWWIENHVPVNVDLPRGYKVVVVRSNMGDDKFLRRGTTFLDGDGGYLHGDFSCPVPAPGRTALLAFAADVASGWLDEVATYIEERGREAAKAAETIRARAAEVQP